MVSMIRELPGSLPEAKGLSKDSASLQHNGDTQGEAPGQAPSQPSLKSEAPPKPAAAGARQAALDARAATDGPDKPVPDAQPNPWAQASFFPGRDEHISSLWQDVRPCWKAPGHAKAFQMRVALDADGNLVRADILRDHSVAGQAVDEATLDGAIDALQACAPYKRFSGAQRTYDVKFPG